jgi:UDP-N-acetylglucosamine--N-acetylmuramyl-(pentapeptide) pyrophosphoryl-undecaprenol N-acetylglucosamine transferase
MRVLIACGGTAGHIFPGLALAEELQKYNKNYQIVIVVSARSRDKRFLKASFSAQSWHLATVSTLALPYKFSLRYINFSLRLVWGLLKSVYIIMRYQPEVVVGFGGYASFAPLVIARIMGIPTLIHEQNLVPGRANQLLSRIVDRIAITFADTEKLFFLNRSDDKIIKTGLPLRKHILFFSRDDRYLQGFTKTSKKFTILVVGGSQGAHKINELVLDCLAHMSEKTKANLQFIHITGKDDFNNSRARYTSLGVHSWVFDFLLDMSCAYRNADLLIGRAGASTIFEAAYFALPCLFIPYVHSSSHQKENALFLERNGAAIVFDETTSSSHDLKEVLQRLITNKNLRGSLSQKIKLFANPQAVHNLKEQIDILCKAQ